MAREATVPPMPVRFKGKGHVPGEEWVYDYIGWLVPVWPNSDADLQRPAIVGSVVRTVPHASSGRGTARPLASSPRFTPSVRTERTPPATSLLILGGGPAGCATAPSLRPKRRRWQWGSIEDLVVRQATPWRSPPPDWLACFLSTSASGQRSRGRAIGVCTARSQPGGSPFCERITPYIPHGAGWRLDRPRFDGFLARQAAQGGVEVLFSQQLIKATGLPDGWHLRLSGVPHAVPASWSMHWPARELCASIGSRQLACDRLACWARFSTLDDAPESAQWLKPGLTDGGTRRWPASLVLSPA